MTVSEVANAISAIASRTYSYHRPNPFNSTSNVTNHL